MKKAIYCRVSTDEQTTENQKIPLIEYCKRMGWEYEIFEETESTKKTRPVQYDLYNRLLRKEFSGLVIYRFDRWARNTKELIEHTETLTNKGVSIYSYTENIDLTSSMGKAMLTIISAFAQLERDILKERTIAGLKRAKNQGKIRGRHPKYCGCQKNGHNGLVKPIRDESQIIIGWQYPNGEIKTIDEKRLGKQTPSENIEVPAV